MHELRTATLAGDLKHGQNPESEERGRRQEGDEANLANLAIPRAARRRANHRQENRFNGVVKRATIFFRRRKLLVRVVNISGGGVMIESGIMPWIGEVIGLEFEGFDRLDAVVRWVKKGRVGLDVGEGTINLG